jgi:lipoate-protein ligase A
MIEIILQISILLILILYTIASIKLTRELLNLSSLNAKHVRLIEFREVFKNLIKEFNAEHKINFETIYLTDKEEEKRIVELILIDLKSLEKEKKN